MALQKLTQRIIEKPVVEKITAENFELDNKKLVYISKKAETTVEGYFLKHFDEASAIEESDIFVVHTVPKVGKVVSNKEIKFMADKVTGAVVAYYDKYSECELANRMEASKRASEKNMATEYQRGIETFVPFFVTKYTAKVADKEGNLKEVVKTPNVPVLIAFNVGDVYFSSSSSAMGDILLDALKEKDEETGEMVYPLMTNKVSVSFKKVKVLQKSLLEKEKAEVKNEVDKYRNDKTILEAQFAELMPIPYKTWYDKAYANSPKVEAEEDDDIDF